MKVAGKKQLEELAYRMVQPLADRLDARVAVAEAEIIKLKEENEEVRRVAEAALRNTQRTEHVYRAKLGELLRTIARLENK